MCYNKGIMTDSQPHPRFGIGEAPIDGFTPEDDLSPDALEASHEANAEAARAVALTGVVGILVNKEPVGSAGSDSGHDTLDDQGIFNAAEIRDRVPGSESYDAAVWLQDWVPSSAQEYNPAKRQLDPVESLRAAASPAVMRAMHSRMQGYRASALRALQVLQSDSEALLMQKQQAIADFYFGKALVEFARRHGGKLSKFPSEQQKLKDESLARAKLARPEDIAYAIANHTARFNYWFNATKKAEAEFPFLGRPE